MNTYEFVWDYLSAIRVPENDYVERLVREAGNEEFEVTRDERTRRVYVTCKYEPRGAVLHGISWKLVKKENPCLPISNVDVTSVRTPKPMHVFVIVVLFLWIRCVRLLTFLP